MALPAEGARIRVHCKSHVGLRKVPACSADMTTGASVTHSPLTKVALSAEGVQVGVQCESHVGPSTMHWGSAALPAGASEEQHGG